MQTVALNRPISIYEKEYAEELNAPQISCLLYRRNYITVLHMARAMCKPRVIEIKAEFLVRTLGSTMSGFVHMILCAGFRTVWWTNHNAIGVANLIDGNLRNSAWGQHCNSGRLNRRYFGAVPGYERGLY